MGMSRLIRICVTALCAMGVAGIALYSVYMLWERAPDIEPVQPAVVSEQPASTSEQPKEDMGLPFDTDRQDGVYTLLLVGNDDGNGNTDTIMLGKLDTTAHKMSFVSIPRDSYINVDWNVRKINSVYWGAVNGGGSGIGALREHVKRLSGFDVDCYAVIDLDVFKQTVDTLGGVYFDVPQALDYEDAGQELYIHIAPGYQLLNGEQAMGVCRYRSGYSDGDLGRINMQHSFLKAAAEQLIKLGNIPNISKVVGLLADGMDTNLSAANIAYLLRQALLCKSEDISFYTAPNTPALVAGYSYAFIDVSDWLALVNSQLNPYTTPVEYGNVDMVYKTANGFAATTYIKGDWYFYRQPDTPEPEPTTQPSQTPQSEPPASETPVIPVIPVIPENPDNTDTPAPPPVTAPQATMEIPGRTIGEIPAGMG